MIPYLGKVTDAGPMISLSVYASELSDHISKKGGENEEE